MKNFAFIPARGGSKGIPQKNLQEIHGKSLISYALDAAKNSNVINETFISSDCQKILDHAKGLGAKTIQRPIHLASDTSSTNDAIRHFIQQIPEDNYLITLLQPTSPMRTSRHIQEALETYEQVEETKVVISVCEPKECIFKAFKLNNNKLEGYFGKSEPYLPRQSFPQVFLPNGAIYIFSKKDFLSQSRIPQSFATPYLMDQTSSLDIDTTEDLQIASVLMKAL